MNDEFTEAATARVTELIPEHWQLQSPESPIAQIITTVADTLRAGKLSIIHVVEDVDGGDIRCLTT